MLAAEKKQNAQTNKLMQHTLATLNDIKHRIDGLVSINLFDLNRKCMLFPPANKACDGEKLLIIFCFVGESSA